MTWGAEWRQLNAVNILTWRKLKTYRSLRTLNSMFSNVILISIFRASSQENWYAVSCFLSFLFVLFSYAAACLWHPAKGTGIPEVFAEVPGRGYPRAIYSTKPQRQTRRVADMESLRNLTLRMRWKFILVVLITVFTLCAQSEYMQGGQEHFENSESLSPTVMITLLVRNKAHVLPYSLEYLTNLDYPKNRMMLW